MTQTHPLAPLIGTWSLLAWYNQTSDGTRIHPFGENPTGYISYSPDGFVFVHMSARSRQAIGSPDPFSGTDAQNSAALTSHITYAGYYEWVSEARVVHHVTQASFPDWVGSQQIRDVTWTDGGLQLSATGADFQGQTVDVFVLWERAPIPTKPDTNSVL